MVLASALDGSYRGRHAAEQASPETDRVDGSPTQTVLVAEDDDEIRELVTFKLEVAGYRVITADNGATALDMVGAEQPDIVVLDISMPYMDGINVCRQLHRAAVTEHIPVLMLSSRALPSDIDLGYAVGADDYLIKPVNPAELIRRVRLLLDATDA